MRVPIHYNVRSLFYRKSATAMTVLAIGLTVAVLIILLSVQQGFQTSVAGTGRADNIVCVRKASTAEASSNISRDDYSRILGTPGIAKNSDGQPLASAEMFAGVTLPRLGGGGITNVSIRGVQLASFDVRGAKVLHGGTAPLYYLRAACERTSPPNRAARSCSRQRWREWWRLIKMNS